MTDKYGQAVMYLPSHLRDTAMSVKEKQTVSEIVLRKGGGISIYSNGREVKFEKMRTVTDADLATVLELASRGSVHTVSESLGKGYITVEGGHRIGVCGTYVKGADKNFRIREVSSVCIRIAREIKGVASGVAPGLVKDGSFLNTLIISPPGHGKTTMLRDLVRLLSDSGFRVSLVDERGEVAAKNGGIPQFDVGRNTDVSDGISKADGAIRMLRSLSPDIIALDEITADEDSLAIERILKCGVGVLATLHGDGIESFCSRDSYKNLRALNAFEAVVVLRKENGKFNYEVLNVKEGEGDFL